MPSSQPTIETGPPATASRCRAACAYRDGEVVCGRVEVTFSTDPRLGLAPRERRCVVARFLELPHPSLRTDLAELVHRRGAVARRAAERMQPIEIVFDDPRLRPITCLIQPPQMRHGRLHDIEFSLREPAP
jgi:hypothetical protein